MLDITDTSVVDVIMRISTVGTEGVINFTGGIATVFQVTELHNLDGVKAGLDAFELTNDGSKIMRLLHELKVTARVGVSEEVELARGSDGLFLLGGGFPVVVDWLSVVSLDITGADRAATNPWEAIGVVGVVAVGVVAVRLVTISTTGTGTAESTGVGTGVQEILNTTMTVFVSVLSIGTHNKSAGESDLREHFDFLIICLLSDSKIISSLVCQRKTVKIITIQLNALTFMTIKTYF